MYGNNFHLLLAKQESYKGWTVLGQVDLEAFVDTHISTAAGFEDNFKAVKARRKEADKLPEIVKVSAAICLVGRPCSRWAADRNHHVKARK